MLQRSEPDDFVVATGETHSVREFVEKAFACIGERIVYIFHLPLKPSSELSLCGSNASLSGGKGKDWMR